MVLWSGLPWFTLVYPGLAGGRGGTLFLADLRTGDEPVGPVRSAPVLGRSNVAGQERNAGFNSEVAAAEASRGSALFFRWRGLPRHRRVDDRHGITQFHHVIHEHFHIVSAGDFEFNLTEEGDVRRAQRGIAQFKF